MNRETPPAHAPARPTPAGTLPLLFGLFAAPAAWAVQLVLSYSLAATPCFAQGAARIGAASVGRGPMLAIAALCLAIGIAGLVVAMRQRRLPIAYHGARRHALATSGVLSSILFLTAIVFSIVVLMTPQCAG